MHEQSNYDKNPSIEFARLCSRLIDFKVQLQIAPQGT